MTRPIRPIRIEGDVAYVTLTRGCEAVIDAADVPLVDGFNWCILAPRHTKYAVRNKREDGILRMHYMHRVIMGVQPGVLIDHISGNGLDNRRSNLRLASISQNAQNMRLPLTNTSGIRGVCWAQARGKWMAQITVNRHYINLGYFDKKEDAAAAYVNASAKYHGEFGRVA
jgi:hypothetical protein